MSKTVTKAQLFDWLSSVFQEEASSLSLERSRQSIPTWDSMGTLLLIAELDEKLKITLSEEELKGLQSIGDIVQTLRSKQVEVVG